MRENPGADAGSASLKHRLRFLPRQRYDFCRLHLVVEYRSISAMLRFEYSFDLQMVTVAQGRRFSSVDNDAAATRGTPQQEDHVFAAIISVSLPTSSGALSTFR